jgi:hypothetical protein
MFGLAVVAEAIEVVRVLANAMRPPHRQLEPFSPDPEQTSRALVVQTKDFETRRAPRSWAVVHVYFAIGLACSRETTSPAPARSSAPTQGVAPPSIGSANATASAIGASASPWVQREFDPATIHVERSGAQITFSAPSGRITFSDNDVTVEGTTIKLRTGSHPVASSRTPPGSVGYPGELPACTTNACGGCYICNIIFLTCCGSIVSGFCGPECNSCGKGNCPN